MKPCPYCAEQIQDAAVVCRYCNRDLPKAVIEPSTPDAEKGAVRVSRKADVFVYGLIGVIGVGVLAVLVGILQGVAPGGSSSSQSHVAVSTPEAAEPGATGKSPAPRDDLEVFLKRFGTPDDDESSATERPRPPIVTRMLTYRREGVRAIYRASVPFGAPPPYDGKWKLIGFTDPMTDKPLKPAIVVERLKERDQGR